jgi:hypothetical protein
MPTGRTHSSGKRQAAVGTWAGLLILAGTLAWTPGPEAIEVAPSPAQIDAALARGKAAAQAKTPPDRLYAWFGSASDLAPRGFVMTKLVGLAVMATHFALRGETPIASEIAQILEEQSLLVSVVLFGERPDFAVDSYMVMTQGERLIKPTRLRFDATASRSPVWPASPAYRAKIVASFAYADFDPRARTRLSVFPARGGEVTFDLDLDRIE